jgi:hypothetical protein
VYALCLGTVLVLTGAVVFISQGRWLLLGLMVLIEAVFVLPSAGWHARHATGAPPNSRAYAKTTAGSTAVVLCSVLFLLVGRRVRTGR